jgi:uncharacterized membrane protein YhhN
MTLPFPQVVLCATVLGVVHLAAYYAGARGLAGFTKAAPIGLLLLWVLVHEPAVGHGYRRLLAAGLLCSMGGDLLLLSRERFRAGLASFFAGHVWYACAFAASASAFVASLGWLVLLGVAAAAMLRVLWRHVARERVPVASYVAMISVMAWMSIARALTPDVPQPSGVLAALGAFVFMASDAILALDRFVRPWHGAHAAVMITYYGAQMLIAASLAR